MVENINVVIGIIALILFIVFCCCVGLFICACIIATFIRAWFVLEDFVDNVFRW